MDISNDENGLDVRYKLNHGLRGSGIRGFYPSDIWHYSLLNIKKSTPRKIVFFGDSILDALKNPMRSQLTNNYYCNGLGFVKLNADGTYNSDQLTMIIANSTFVEDATNADEWGISGEVCKLSETGTLSFTQTDQSGEDNEYWFTAFNIYYLRRSGGGTFQYRVDGGSWVQVDTDNASSVLGIVTVESIGLEYPGNHLIEIESVSGENWIYGLRTYVQNASGITPDFINQGGSSAEQWATRTHYLDYLADVSPDQVNIMLGFNDHGSSRTASEFIADIETIVTAIQAEVNSYCDIIIWSHYDTGTAGDINIPQDDYNAALALYDDEIRTYCMDNGLSFFDLQLIVPPRPIGGDMGIWADTVHLNATGGSYLCRKILEFISLPASNENISNQGTQYIDANLRIVRTGEIGFFRRTSGGDILDLSLRMYSLNDNRLYIDCGAYGTYIMRDYFDVPVPISPPTVADTAAPNSTLFIGSDHSNKLCFKDSGGVVNELY